MILIINITIAMAIFSVPFFLYNHDCKKLSILILFYTGALTLNAIYIQSIGSGIGTYNGLSWSMTHDIIILSMLILLLNWSLIFDNRFINKLFLINKILFIRSDLIYYLNNILNNLFIVLSINRSPLTFKSINNLIIYFILLSLGLICSLLTRFDYIAHIFNSLPIELNISIRIISLLFSIYSIFLLTILIINGIYFYKYCLNNIVKSSIKIMFTLYLLYILLVNIIIFLINYNSINLLDIVLLKELCLLLYVYSIIYGILFGLFIIKKDYDLSKQLSKFGKICLFTFIISWISLFIAMRLGLIIQLANKLGLIDNIYCESTSDSKIDTSSNTNPTEKSTTSIGSGNTNSTTSIINVATEGSNVTGNTNTPTNITPQSKVKIILSESVSIFKEVQIMRRNNSITEWGDAMFRNKNLMVYYQSDHFKEEIKEAILSMLEYNDKGEIDIQLTKDKLNPVFLSKYNLDNLSDKELELILTLNPKLKIKGDVLEIIKVVNPIDLNIRRDNSEYFYLTQRSCLGKNEDYCFRCLYCYNRCLNKLEKSTLGPKLIYNLDYLNEQTNSNYIPFFRIFQNNLSYLHEMLKNNEVKSFYKELFDFNEDKTLSFRDIQLIDSFIIYKKDIKGYWTGNDFERFKGIYWADSIDRYIMVRNNNFIVSDWDSIKPLKIKVNTFNGHNILFRIKAVDENGWIYDRKHKVAQFLTNNGTVISLSLKDNFDLLGKDLIDLNVLFNLDYLILGDDSTNIIYLYKSLCNTFNTSIYDSYYKSVIKKGDNFFKTTFACFLLHTKGFHTEMEYSFIIKRLESKILQELFKGDKIINKNFIKKLKSATLFEAGIPFVYKGNVHILIPISNNGNFTFLNVPLKLFKLNEINKIKEIYKINSLDNLIDKYPFDQFIRSKIEDYIKQHNKDPNFKNSMRTKLLELADKP